MNHYFVVTTGSRIEIEVVIDVKPPRILLSYWYFRNRSLTDFIEQIGYQPEIMLDSGAFSAFNKNKNIAPIDYMDYIVENRAFITHYIALDVIGRPETTVRYYTLLKAEGFSPLPVYHYGSKIDFLEFYIANGETYIALGNTVPESNKEKVAQWVNYLICRYPGIKFHLLGSSSEEIQSVEGLESTDSSSWFMMAINGYPHSIPEMTREAKFKRAKVNMQKDLSKVPKSKSVQLLLFIN